MQYTVCSRGRPIGTTDLGFTPVFEHCRVGWFHPNADGERLMPVLAAVLPAVRAWFENGRTGGAHHAADPSSAAPHLMADVKEALHRADALDLTLHEPDGSLVRTTLVGIQDVEQLRALAVRDEVPDWEEVGLFGDDLDEFEDDFLDDFEDDFFGAADPTCEADLSILGNLDDRPEPWMPPSDTAPLPRYQVVVEFAGRGASRGEPPPRG